MMMNELIEKLYYNVCDMPDENPMREESFHEHNMAAERAAAELKKFAPGALVEDLVTADFECCEIYGKGMFLLGLKSAMTLLECLHDPVPLPPAKKPETEAAAGSDPICIQAIVSGTPKVADWTGIHKEIDSAMLDIPVKKSQENRYILPSLTRPEYETLCSILNDLYLGIPIPKTPESDHLRSRIFKSTTSVDAEAIQQLSGVPYVIRMENVPVIGTAPCKKTSAGGMNGIE